jgi:hypothetical protein
LRSGSVCGAFANLHAARVVLVDLYAEEDIQAAAPAVLARLRTCLPPADQRLQRAEEMFGSLISGVPADVHSHSWLTREDRIQPAKRRPLTFRGHPGCSAGELAFRRAELRDAMQISYDAADEQYACPCPQLPGRHDHRDCSAELAGTRDVPARRPESKGNPSLLQPVIHICCRGG